MVAQGVGAPRRRGGGGWALGWLVCMRKVCPQVSCSLFLGIT